MTPAEAGLQVMARLGGQPLDPELDVHFKWPKCLACGRRPTMTVKKSTFLLMLTGLAEEKVLNVPRYEILPCCSAKYVREPNGRRDKF